MSFIYSVLKTKIKIINFVKSKPLNVRLLHDGTQTKRTFSGHLIRFFKMAAVCARNQFRAKGDSSNIPHKVPIISLVYKR